MSGAMRAGVASETGLDVREVAIPTPGPGQVLVRIAAAGMNRADLMAAKGAGVATKESLGRPIGMEWAGEVVATGDEITAPAIGDNVMCSGTGGYAEYAIADAGRCIKLPASFDMERAATLPLVAMTAHNAVVTNGQLASGESILVQGATSAVGLMTLQIARVMGATIIAGTSTTPERRARLAEFGATHSIDPSVEGWPDDLVAATGDGAHVIVDMVSGSSVNQSMQAAAVGARMVNVGRLGGVSGEVDFNLHAAKRITYTGVTFRTRALEEIREITARTRDDLWPHLEAGRIALPIDRRFALADAPAAHAHMAANAHFGKIVLVP